MAMKNGALNVALLMSGGGTTATAILKACNAQDLKHVKPVLAISSNPKARGIQRLIDAGMNEKDVVVLRRSAFSSQEVFGQAILEECHARGVDLIGQYGWLPLTPGNVIDVYGKNVVNQHPGPLWRSGLDFGGQGMYGIRVHSARLQFVRETRRAAWTDVVAHRVTKEGYDLGPVIHRGRVAIHDGDTPESLQERALPVEHAVQIETLQIIANGMDETIHPYERSKLVHEHEVGVLQAAKTAAIRRYPKG
jgi:phosphoribosylglycinamide formyltransferase-1